MTQTTPVSTAPSGYTGVQIALHWIVAVLIGFQIVAHDGMEAAWQAAVRGGVVSGLDTTMAYTHIAAGVAIWLFAAWRLVLRVRYGVPPLPENEPPALKLVAHGIHLILYLVLLLMPISGAVAWFGGAEGAAEAHELMKFVLLPAVLIHVAGALFQHYWIKSDVLRRMVRPLLSRS